MYVNNNLYFVVGNLVTEIYFFQEVIIYLCLGEKSVFLANSPYFPLSSIIPFVRLTTMSESEFTVYGSRWYILGIYSLFASSQVKIVNQI